MVEMFDYNKHEEDFLADKLAVHCKTHDAAKEFVEFCSKKGFRWASGRALIGNDNWDTYKEQTCYCFSCGDGIARGTKRWFEGQGYKVVEYGFTNITLEEYIKQRKCN